MGVAAAAEPPVMEERQAVNPACPNAANPFHRCADYCPVPAPAAATAKPPPPPPSSRPAQNGTAAPQNGTAAAQNGIAEQNGSTHSDGELQAKPRRRDRAGGSGGLPFYVFREHLPSFAPISSQQLSEESMRIRFDLGFGAVVREGADGDGKKVDPRCPNAPNPFHVCTEHCAAKMAEVSRSSEGGKSPMSLFSRHSRRSSSSSEGFCLSLLDSLLATDR